MPPFKAAVEAGVASIMPGFHDLAGIPMTAHRAVLNDLVRDQWGFEGMMISDYNAITELLAHGTAGDMAEAAAAALKAGVDIDLMGDAYAQGLPDALERGLVEEAEIDQAVRRILTLKEALGLFDDPYGRGKADFLPPMQINAHKNLAREAGKRSIVLLTNHDGILPLADPPARIAVIGPLADNRDEMLGPWSIVGKGEDMVSILEGIEAAFPSCEIEHAAGGVINDATDGDIAEAIDIASRADLVILCLGEKAEMSGEAASRAELDLPGRQAQLARTVLDLQKPTIALLSSGRQLCCPWLFERADAVLATWFLGNEAGHAIADVLTGKHNPVRPAAGLLADRRWPDPHPLPAAADGAASQPAGALFQQISGPAGGAAIPVRPWPFLHGVHPRQSQRDAVKRSVPGDKITIEVDVENIGEVFG